MSSGPDGTGNPQCHPLHPSKRPPSFLKKQPGCWPRKTLSVLCCSSQVHKVLPHSLLPESHGGGGRGREAVQERGFGVSRELVLLSATGETER